MTLPYKILKQKSTLAGTNKYDTINKEFMQNITYSVIIPTYNRVQSLHKIITAVLSQTRQADEIIIVNDGSTDGTQRFLESIQNSRIQYITQKQNYGTAKARNSGIQVAKGSHLVFLDDDCTPIPTWLKTFDTAIKKNYADCFIGGIEYVASNYSGFFPEYIVKNKNAEWPMAGNIIYTKDVLQHIGFFRDEYYRTYHNEDSELAIRLVHKGFQYIRVPKARVYHQSQIWSTKKLLYSAHHAAVWVKLKKEYPLEYSSFGCPIIFGCIVQPLDYIYLLFFPIFIPILFTRYLWHKKYNFILFFVKWPVILFLRRYYLWQKAVQEHIFFF